MAGNGTYGYSGDGGAATSAQLNHTNNVAVDGTGNIYIADGNHVIRKVSSSGVISTVAGNGTYGYSGDGGAATNAKFNNITDVVVDGSGNIYLVDQNNNRIRKVVNAVTFTYNFSGNKSFRDLGAVLTNVNTSQFNSSKVYSYDNNNWAAYSGVMTPGKGYRILVDGTATPTITTTGSAVLTGNQSLSLTSGLNSYSFIANPYQSQVDFTALTQSGLYNGYWYFDPTNIVNNYQGYKFYGTYTGASNTYGGGLTLNKYIQPGQGFFVCSNISGTPTLTFTEASKITGVTPVSVLGATAPLNRIATGLFKNGNNVDGAVAVFNSNFSDGIDANDGVKMNNQGENLTFLVASKELCANAWSLPLATDKLPMHLYNLTANTTYTLKLDASQFNGNGLSAYLQDNVLNTKKLLLGANNEVNFSTGSNVATDANRYTLVFGASTLPISAINLTVTELANKQVAVNWTVTDEKNIANYTIQYSANGISYTDITTVNAGVSSYIVATTTSGGYYRIKTTDNSGTITYSNVVSLFPDHSTLTTMTVSPNPVTNNCFKLRLATIGRYNLSVIDKLGKTVFTTTINHRSASTLENVSIKSKLAAGGYTLSAVDENGKVSTTQVIIQ